MFKNSINAWEDPRGHQQRQHGRQSPRDLRVEKGKPMREKSSRLRLHFYAAGRPLERVAHLPVEPGSKREMTP